MTARTAPDNARPRVCIVGPGWHFTSGMSYYTCRLATALQARYDVSVILLRRLIPRLLYPGRKRVGKSLSTLVYPTSIPTLDGVDWFWGITMLRAFGFLRRHRPNVLIIQWWTGAVAHTQLLLAVLARRYGGLRRLRDPDFAVIAAALGSRTRARGELLSFLLFDEDFIAALLRLGARDARRWLRRHPRFWCRDAAHDLSFARYDSEAVHEQEAIAEFRARRLH